MERAEHISKLHPALDSGELKSGSREVQWENQRVELFSKQLTANRPALRRFSPQNCCVVRRWKIASKKSRSLSGRNTITVGMRSLLGASHLPVRGLKLSVG